MCVCLFMSSTALSLHSEFYFLTKIYWILCNHVKILFMLSCVSFICSWLFFFKHVPDSTAGNGPSQRRSISGNIQRMSDASVERPLPLWILQIFSGYIPTWGYSDIQTRGARRRSSRKCQGTSPDFSACLKTAHFLFFNLHSEFPCCWNRQ